MGEVHVVLPEGPLEAVQDGIQGDTLLNGEVGVPLEPVEQLHFVEVVEGVHDLVGEADEAIDGLDGLAEVAVEHPDTQAERGAVRLRCEGAALP